MSRRRARVAAVATAGVLTLVGLAAWGSRGRPPTSRGGEDATAGSADRARPRTALASAPSPAIQAPGRPGGDSSVPAWDAAALAALGLVPSPASELPVPPVPPAHRHALARRAEARFDARLRASAYALRFMRCRFTRCRFTRCRFTRCREGHAPWLAG